MKTKKIAGVDLDSDCFAFVGNSEDSTTWKLPLFIPGNECLTRNHIKNALHRFAETSIPDAERTDVWRMIVGACRAHGIKVGKQPTPVARPELVEPLDAVDVETKEARALGELAAERLLKQMGYGI